ncbi:MAG: DMT family transporter [Gammaproteobacteria bacterium]|nr:DMT family transporter [Gammaproteobacteria bacterium]
MSACTLPYVSVALALVSALLFSLGIQLSRSGLRHLDPRSATLVTIGTATALYWIASPLFVERYFWLSPAVALFALIGLFRPALSGNLAMAGTFYLGPTISSALAATAPLFGVGLGVLALGEQAGPGVLLGTLAIVAGVVLLSRRGESLGAWPWWALLLPIGAALLRSLAQALAKLGMETLPSPFFVGLVGYSVSFLVALAYQGRRREPLALVARSPGLKWMVAAGACYGFAILSLNFALACGRLVVVAPIVACSPLFTMLLGLLVFREHGIGIRVALAVMLIVPGVLLVTSRA